MSLKGYLLLFGGVAVWLAVCYWGETRLRRRIEKRRV